MRKLWLYLVFAFYCSGVGQAAEIEKLDVPGQSISFVFVKGEIVEGDASRFLKVVDGAEQVSVVLQSPGGLVREALQIGAEIRIRNYATMVVAGHECYSACGLIWVSGARRYLSRTSKIGFHAAYREENGEYRESGVANAEIGSFLTHLGLRIEAIRYFTVAGPAEFLMLTPERARSLGIEVFEQDGVNVTAPSEAPSVDVLADRFISYSFLNSRCSKLFEAEQKVVDGAIRDVFDRAHELVDGDSWIDLWMPMLDSVKQEIESKGVLSLCLETESHLRSQGQITGITGPSFPCSAAGTPTEKALCTTAGLWAKDRAMNSVYFYIRRFPDVQLRKALLADQREWLRRRNACGAHVQCLNASYDQRLQLFHEIDVGN